MENYKSIHTGEQIDAAIAQVLAKNFPFSIVATANDVHLPSLENGQHIFIQDENKLYRYKNSTLVEDAINYILDLGWFGSEEQAYAEAAAYDNSTKEYIYKDKRILFAEFPIPKQPDVNKTEKIIILQNTSYHRTALFLFKDGKFYLRHLGWDMDGWLLNPTWIETLPSHLAWDDETHTLSLKQWGETINEEQQIPLADGTKAGLMSKEDKVKLDSFLDSSLYKVVQKAKNSPNASGSTYQFIDAISQNSQGVITATKKSVREASINQSGLMSASDKTKINNLKTVATTGNYDDLNNKPITINWSVLLEPQQVTFNMTSIESTPELVLLNIDNNTVNLMNLRNINLLDSYSMLTILNSTFTHVLDVAISYDDSQIVNKRLYTDFNLSSIIDSAQLQSGKNVLITITEIYFTITFRSPSGDVYLHLCPLSCKTFDEYINWPNVPNKAPLSKNGSIFYSSYLVVANSNDAIRINTIYELAYS